MSGFIDPVALARAREDGHNQTETREHYQQFMYLIYQRDGDAAENAKNILLASIETQFQSARALVEQVTPAGARKPRLSRPLSKDEGNPYGR